MTDNQKSKKVVASHIESWGAFLTKMPTITAIGATLLLLSVTVYAFISLGGFTASKEGFEKMGAFGSLVTGFGGSAALIWMAATFVLQMRELSLQRQELSLQRKAQQNKVVIDFYPIMIEPLSAIARDILISIVLPACHDEFVLNIDNLDALFSAGKRDVYFIEFLERQDIQQMLSLKAKDPFTKDLVAYYIDKFDIQLDSSLKVIAELSEAATLSEFMRERTTFIDVRTLLKKLAASES